MLCKPTISHRLFNCRRCRRQTRICPCCDRGNQYCSPECSQAARRESNLKSSRRYQATKRGRANHAARQQQYLSRKMTQQGSLTEVLVLKGKEPARISSTVPSNAPATPLPTNDKDSLESHAPVEGLRSVPAAVAPLERDFCCHFCGAPTSPFARLTFLCTSTAPAGRWPGR